MTMILAPRLAAFFRKVAATGWFCSGRAPMMILQSLSLAAPKGAVTAPEPMPSINTTTEEAWPRRVQRSKVLVRKGVRHSFWERKGYTFHPLDAPTHASPLEHVDHGTASCR